MTSSVEFQFDKGKLHTRRYLLLAFETCVRMCMRVNGCWCVYACVWVSVCYAVFWFSYSFAHASDVSFDISKRYGRFGVRN